jgi:hypothetical protein
MTGGATTALVAAMPPPAAPTPGSWTWEELEQDLPIRWPADLRELLETYGQGGVGGELQLLDPRNQIRFWNVAGGDLKAMRELGPEASAPRPPFPSKDPSLLPIAVNGSGDGIYLVVRDGEVSEASLWIGNINADAWIEEEGTLAAFLLRVVSGQFDGRDVIGTPNWRLASVFEPIRDF